jgi:hypothetical protein
MKSPIAFLIVVLAIGTMSDAFAQSPPVSGGSPAGGIALPGADSGGTGSTGAKSAATPNENNTDENDDTLYRGKTSETENPMLRDEGPLHFKTRPKEKVQEVDSLKKLQSSGSDPKFQGNLLYSGVTSIENVTAKANETRNEADQGDPRFKTKRLTFSPDKNDEPKKAQSDSSPSPTPSPTASPTAKDSRAPKQ